MVALSRGVKERIAAEDARKQARQREADRLARERLEAEERKLLAEAEAEAERLAPPAERKELPPAEVARRLELLEAQRPGPDGARRDSQIAGRYLRRDRLRRVRAQKAVVEQDARDQQHAKRVAGVTAQLEASIQEAEAQRTALVDRQADELAEVDGTLADCRHKLGELVRSLPPEESTEQRLERLELVS